MIFETNKIFLGMVAIFLIIIGAVFYTGIREFSQINNQLASLQEQLAPLFEKSIEIIPEEPIAPATTTEAAEPVPEPEEEVNVCDSLNCDAQDGWTNSGSAFTCKNESNKTCACQTQAYFDYSCSNLKQKCVYSTTNTRTNKYNCVEPEPTHPDFVFQSPGFSPALPNTGDQMFFWATLKNQGSASAASSLSYLKIDGQKIAESSAVSLASNGSIVSAWATSWSAVAGSHELEVCADGALQVAESNETNNCAKITFTVGGAVVPADETALLPDFIIESIDISPDPLSAGQSVSFAATVKNQGRAVAKPSLTVSRLDLGNDGSWNEFPGAVSTPAIAVNGNKIMMWRDVWMSSRGTHKIEICADAVSEPEFRITESNEANNCLSRIITVP